MLAGKTGWPLRRSKTFLLFERSWGKKRMSKSFGPGGEFKDMGQGEATSIIAFAWGAVYKCIRDSMWKGSQKGHCELLKDLL